MNHIDFSKMTHEEAVGRLEAVQAMLSTLATQAMAKIVGEEDSAKKNGIYGAFNDGSLTATCIALDYVQGRGVGENLRHLAHRSKGTPEPPCEPDLFV
jgi:hypothetical protein